MIERTYRRSRRLAGALERRLWGKKQAAIAQVPYTRPAIRPEALAQNGGPFLVAVIGAGNQGRDLCRGMLALHGAELTAVADRSNEALVRLRAQVSVPQTRLYNDAQKLLQSESVDLVCIATNTPSHVPIACMAVETGVRRLLVEKPIGTCPAGARQLVEMCAEEGVTLAVNHSRRWSLDYTAMKRYIAAGRIGPVRHVYVAFGSGGLAMNGVHFIDLMRFFIGGDISWAIGFLDQVTEPNKRGNEYYDPGGYGLLHFSNGARGFIDLSQDLLRKDAFLVVKTAYSRIEVDERARQWVLVSQDGRYSIPFVDATSPAGYASRVVAELLSGDTPRSSGADGVAALETVIAMHLSHAQNHQPIALPLNVEQQLTRIPFP